MRTKDVTQLITGNVSSPQQSRVCTSWVAVVSGLCGCRYDYSLSVQGGSAIVVNASSIYGAHYALESLRQVVMRDTSAGLAMVQHSTLFIQDEPQ